MAKYEAIIITMAHIFEHLLILSTTLWYNYHFYCFHFTNEELRLSKIKQLTEVGQRRWRTGYTWADSGAHLLNYFMKDKDQIL